MKNKVRYIIILLLLASPSLAAYPYDAVGRVSTGGSGTMVYVSGNQGLIATNAHVVTTSSKVTVTWGQHQRVCHTVFVDYNTDIALLVCKNPPVKAVPHRKLYGNFVVSTGYPYYQRSALHWQASLALRIEEGTLWVTHKPVPGMSGGGAFDCGGYLIGIVQQHSETDGGIVSGLPLRIALEVFKDPKAWVHDASHVKNPPDINYAPQDGQVRSIKYHLDTAPELPWPGK